jgi:biopolymer transport protein ExbD
MNFGKDLLVEDESTDINVTSLVDVVLNLLFFFMVSTTFSQTLGIKVNLPVTTTASVETVQKEITVSIKENGQVYLAEAPVAVDSLPGAFGKLLSEGSRSALILRADEKVNHGRVVQVMDLAKKAGIQKIAIATAPKE